MRMTTEQFKNEVYRRRDEAIRLRKNRIRIIAAVVPIFLCLAVSVVFFNNDLFIGPDKASKQEEVAAGTDTGGVKAMLGADGNIELNDEAAEWLVYNFDMATGNASDYAVSESPYLSSTDDCGADTSAQSLPDGEIIILKGEAYNQRFILNEYGLYSVSLKKYIVDDKEALTQFRKMLEK